jgi:hypothetical protein
VPLKDERRTVRDAVLDHGFPDWLGESQLIVAHPPAVRFSRSPIDC